MRKEFLGRGFSFPFEVNPATGAVAMSEYEENIRQCVSVVLGTKPGERQMLPEFGCRIHELLFAPHTQATAALISHYVRESLQRWEPRVELVRVRSRPERGGAIRVEVDYKVIATNAVATLTQTVASH